MIIIQGTKLKIVKKKKKKTNKTFETIQNSISIDCKVVDLLNSALLATEMFIKLLG